MALPNLLNATPVKIVKINKPAAVTVARRREAPRGGRSYETPVEVLAQVAFAGQGAGQDNFRATISGLVQDTLGYCFFRIQDLKDLDLYPLISGDRLVELFGDSVNYYFVKFQPAGQYSDQGGATLLAAYFVDRAPGEVVR